MISAIVAHSEAKTFQRRKYTGSWKREANIITFNDFGGSIRLFSLKKELHHTSIQNFPEKRPVLGNPPPPPPKKPKNIYIYIYLFNGVFHRKSRRANSSMLVHASTMVLTRVVKSSTRDPK